MLEFQRATKPLSGALESLIEGDDEHEIDPEVKRYLRHIQGHVVQVTEQVEGFHDLLSNILIVNLTLVSVGQADQSKKISAWASHPDNPDDHLGHLRDELRAPARTNVGIRLPIGAYPDSDDLWVALRRLQKGWMDVA